ncbi:sel1 repeat family protein [Vibrio cholerae]|uniref:sel1 repeat family protein n=1 Tax=Vibrio cholerae TaxID=666 RepID=UPI000F0B067D|nr:sel1 repeat family protein [Vibrio cholerae]MDP4497287.1 sel1 repeat family protein [Vibrio cholerae]RNE57419.1 sel1 repeat family protein [Vibrio cholerae]WLP78412.1 sel1 repeat family protein [Vibrio cholerae]GHY94323.1 tryptophanase [Vibrio cholerae]
MKPYPNRLTRFVLLLSIMVGLVACKPNPQDDIALFQPFITENINKKSADPYISSTVKPGDKMYDFLLSLQRGSTNNHDLKPLINEGNTDAMVWYARLMMMYIDERNYSRELLQRAFFEGNPYAALELSDIGESCFYLGKLTLHRQVAESLNLESSADSQLNVCAKENRQIAIKGFEQLAEQGDLRAQYFLLQQQELDKSKETRAQYIQEVIRFSQNHYYQPLMDYVNTILTRPQGKDKYEARTTEQYNLAIDLLTIASNNNYIPAINKLSFLLEDTAQEESERLINLSLKLGSTSTVKYKYHRSNRDSEEKYFYNALYKDLTGEYSFDVHTLNEEEKAKVNEKVKLFMKDITPMVYIDGFTSHYNWVD